MKRFLFILFILAGINSYAQFSPNIGSRHLSVEFSRADGQTSSNQYFGITPWGTWGKYTYPNTDTIIAKSSGQSFTYDTIIALPSRYAPIYRIDLYNNSRFSNIKLPTLTEDLNKEIQLGRLQVFSDTIIMGNNNYRAIGVGTYPKLSQYKYLDVGKSLINESHCAMDLSAIDSGYIADESKIKAAYGWASLPDRTAISLGANAPDSVLTLHLDSAWARVSLASPNGINCKNRKQELILDKGIQSGLLMYHQSDAVDSLYIEYNGTDLIYIQCSGANQDYPAVWQFNFDSVEYFYALQITADTFDLRSFKANKIYLKSMQYTDNIILPDSINDLELSSTYIDTMTVKYYMLDYPDRFYLQGANFDSISFDGFNINKEFNLYFTTNQDTVDFTNTNFRAIDRFSSSSTVLKLNPYYDWVDMDLETQTNLIPIGDTLRYLVIGNYPVKFSKFDINNYSTLDTLLGVYMYYIDTINIKTGLEYYTNDTTAEVTFYFSGTDTISFETSTCKQPINMRIYQPDITKQTEFDLSNYYKLKLAQYSAGSSTVNNDVILPSNHVDSIIAIDYTRIAPIDSLIDLSIYKMPSVKLLYVPYGIKVKMPTDSIDVTLEYVSLQNSLIDSIDFSYYKMFTLGTASTNYFYAYHCDSLKYLKFPKDFTPYRLYITYNDNYIDCFTGTSGEGVTDRSSMQVFLQWGNKSAAVVNHYLYDLDQISSSGYTGRRIYINYGTNAPPDETSGGYDGIAAKNSLISKGFTIYTN